VGGRPREMGKRLWKHQDTPKAARTQEAKIPEKKELQRSEMEILPCIFLTHCWLLSCTSPGEERSRHQAGSDDWEAEK
jgi:hypothetical protein